MLLHRQRALILIHDCYFTIYHQQIRCDIFAIILLNINVLGIRRCEIAALYLQ
jgi:hypothetical protein